MYYEKLVPDGYVKEEDAEPHLGPLDFYLDAFSELQTCRPVGMGLQPIPFTAIAEYSRIYDIDDVEDFAYLMRLMDRTFLRLKGAGANASNNGNKTDNNKR